MLQRTPHHGTLSDQYGAPTTTTTTTRTTTIEGCFARRKPTKSRLRIRKTVRLNVVVLVLLLALSLICGIRLFRSSKYLLAAPSSSSLEDPAVSAENNNHKQDLGHTLTSTSTTTRTGDSTVTLLGNSTTASNIQTNENSVQKYQQSRILEPNATFSFCVLLKDDNDILNEWLAYHYHTLNLRHVVVATDPSNTTSSSTIFQQWRREFGLQVDEWTDSDYMPHFFLQGRYDQVPSFLPDYIKANISASRWHVSAGITDVQVIQHDLQNINNHRFRQAVFLHKCVQFLRQRRRQQSQHPLSGPTWMAHIDTDEYIVVNPRIRARSPKVLKGIAPAMPFASSIINFLEQMFLDHPKRLHRPCLPLPSVLFGAVEDDNNDNQTKAAAARDQSSIPIGWNKTRFETLRWNYHAAWNDTINGLQKTIMDVSVLPANDMIFHRHAHSIHRPSNQSCRPMTLYPDVDAIRRYPLTVNHYVGSSQRYRSRADVRRNEQVYRTKARVHEGGKDDDWMAGWLKSFIATHGHEQVSRVLKEYLLVEERSS
jgi:hypothetical protein